jgi:hypothetical protein
MATPRHNLGTWCKETVDIVRHESQILRKQIFKRLGIRVDGFIGKEN